MQGLILTHTHNLPDLLAAMRANHIPLLKVVTGWGWPWDAESRALAASMTTLLVRTEAGDGCASPGQIVFLEPPIVMAQIEPWVMTRGQIMVELGNEPNMGDPSDDAAWVWQYWFDQTAMQIRARWPSVRIVSPGLTEHRQAEWWAICQPVYAKWADAIGYHAYAWHTFDASDTGQIQQAHEQLRRFFPDRPWLLSEAGINDAATSAETKAERYGALHSKLPSNTAAACWYHACDQPLDDGDQAAYALPASAFDALRAGGSV